MNSKSIIILFLILYFPFQGITQSFRSGYVITNERDTINGLIKYTGSQKSAKSCLFKITDEAKVTEYKPGEIYAYRLNEGKFFVSREVDQQMLFLEYLIQGTANMYYSTDNHGPHYFIETEGSGFVELTEPNRIFESDTGTYQLPPLYPGKLVASLNEYEGINSRVAEVKLTHNSLIDLAKDYHDYVCDSVECIIFETKIKPLIFQFGLYGGLVLNHLDFGRKVDSELHPGFEFGGFITAHHLLISSERFWFRADLAFQYQNSFSFTSAKNNTESERITYNGITYYLNPTKNMVIDNNHTLVTKLDADLQLLYLKIPVTLNYYILMGKTRPYFGGGPVALFALSQNKEFQYLDFIDDYGQSIPPFLLGYRLQAGISRDCGKKGKLIGEISYEQLLNLSGLHDYQRLYTWMMGVRIGYAF